MENTDLLIFSGQSNMQGQTECFPGINVTELLSAKADRFDLRLEAA